MADLQQVIADWGEALTVVRTAQGTRSNGRYTSGSTSNVSITANVQPITGRELQSLQETVHHQEIRVLFTETELFTATPGVREADKVTIGSETWIVHKVEKWSAPGFGTHYRCYIAKVI